MMENENKWQLIIQHFGAISVQKTQQRGRTRLFQLTVFEEKPRLNREMAMKRLTRSSGRRKLRATAELKRYAARRIIHGINNFTASTVLVTARHSV
jgi:hypothetical protein